MQMEFVEMIEWIEIESDYQKQEAKAQEDAIAKASAGRQGRRRL